MNHPPDPLVLNRRSSKINSVLSLTLYLVALINPLSKVFILSVLLKENGKKDINNIALRSSVIALMILLTISASGKLILDHVFHVELYSMKVAGGLVLFYFGFMALTKGVFFEVCEHQSLKELSLVPLASPMIAGPATITAVISFTPEYGFAVTAAAMTLAVFVNLAIMFSSRFIGGFLSSHNIMGALIRITGLVVATMAVQMCLSGISAWYDGLA